MWGRWKTIVGVIRPVRQLVALSCLLALIAGVAESVVLVVIVFVAAHMNSPATITSAVLIPENASNGRLLLIAGGLCLIMFGAHIAVERLTGIVASRATLRAQYRFIDAYLNSGVEHRQQLPVTYLSEGLSPLAFETYATVVGFIGVSTSILALLPLIVMSSLVDFGAAIALGIVAVLITLLTRPLVHRTRRLIERRIRRREDLVEASSHWSRLGEEVRIFDVEDALAELLQKRSRGAIEAHASSRLSQRSLMVGRRDVVIGAVIAALAIIYSIDSTSITSIGAVVILLLRVLQGVQRSQTSLQDLESSLPSLERLRSRTEELERFGRSPGTTHIENFDVIELRDVHYSFSGPDGSQVVHDVSFTARRGEIVAIVGPSGGGKSTLVRLILRLARPTRGALLVNGVDIHEVDDSDWVRLVSGVAQESAVLDGDIIENIAFLRPQIDVNRVVESARLSQVDDEVRSFPDGYETRLGPGEGGVSGGQKQRVALARALAGRPQLLVLDEPTSALDPVSEARVRDSLLTARRDAAIIVVAHRPALVEIADRVVTIEEGRVTRIDERRKVEP